MTSLPPPNPPTPPSPAVPPSLDGVTLTPAGTVDQSHVNPAARTVGWVTGVGVSEIATLAATRTDNPEGRTLLVGGLRGHFGAVDHALPPAMQTCDRVIVGGNMIDITTVGEHPIPLRGERDKNGANSRTLIALLGLASVNPSVTCLMGPDELLTLHEPGEAPWLYERSFAALSEAWQTGALPVAAAVNDVLVTHAGLTYGRWLQLGRPQTAQAAADAINTTMVGTYFLGDALATTGTINMAADPLFADPDIELYLPWLLAANEPCPFRQAHFSGSLGWLDTRQRAVTEVSLLERIPRSGHSWGAVAQVNGQSFIGADVLWPVNDVDAKEPESGFCIIEHTSTPPPEPKPVGPLAPAKKGRRKSRRKRTYHM